MILIVDLMAIVKQTNRLLKLPTIFCLAVMPSTRAAVKASTRARVKASTRAARGDKGRRQRDEDPPTVEAVLKLPRLDELYLCNEKRETQVVLKEKDW